MKESTGGIGLFIIVIALVILFTGVMSFTVNRSNSFAIKDEIISILEKNGGIDFNSTWDPDTESGNTTLGKIVEVLYNHKYRQTGVCPNPCSGVELCYTDVGCWTRDGKELSVGEKGASIVILRYDGKPVDNGTTDPIYYQVLVYYSLDLPIINDVFTFKVTGETKPMYQQEFKNVRSH